MNTSMHDVSSIVISKTDMETFGTVEVEVTTSRGEKLKLTCFHNNDAPITLETGE
jgi:hypothetical protein|tara:strand:- start:31 stop:195 length:165 start_codon:yes stop_codon:yes gene_type:complete